MNSIYKEKERGLLNNKDSIEVLILGNSHAYNGVNPSEFSKKTFNLANVGQSLYFDKRITLRHLDKLKKLKYVFISIDYHSLYFSSQGFRDYWSYYGHGIKYKNKSYIFAELSPFLFGYGPKVSLSFLKTEISKKIRFNDKNYIDFNIQRGINPLDTIANGFLGYEATSEIYFEKEQIIKKAKYLNRPTVSLREEQSEILEDLVDFIRILKKNEITPILFTAPIYPELSKYLNTHIQENNRKITYELCDQFNINYYNFANSSKFKKNDFFDSDHLNKRGAKTLSGILENVLNDSLRKRIQ